MESDLSRAGLAELCVLNTIRVHITIAMAILEIMNHVRCMKQNAYRQKIGKINLTNRLLLVYFAEKSFQELSPRESLL